MELKEGNIYAKIAVITLVVAFLLHLIAFAAPSWAQSNPEVARRRDHIGLWRYCTSPIQGSERCDDFIDVIVGDWLKSCQAFMTFGFFGMLASLGLVIVHAMNVGGNISAVGAMAATGFTGLFIMITVAVWAGKYGEWFADRDSTLGAAAGVLSWAFGVGCASCFLTFVTLALILVGLIIHRDE